MNSNAPGQGDQGYGYSTTTRVETDTDTNVPPQVDLAFDLLRWGNTIEMAANTSGYSDSESGRRQLQPKEKALYEAAIEVIRLYLTGEMTFSRIDSDLLEKNEISSNNKTHHEKSLK